MSAVESGERGGGTGLGDAVSFLTVVPVPRRATSAAGRARAAAWFPLVGAALAVPSAALRYAGNGRLGAFAASVLAIVLLVVITGGLHLDGLADTADAIGARGDRERTLAVMREPAIGAYGALALVSWCLVMVGATTSLSRGHAAVSLVAAASLGRWSALAQGRLLRPARSGGLGASLTVSRGAFAIGSATAVVVAIAGCGTSAAAVAVVVGIAAALLTSLGARRLVGGRTGDTLGMSVTVTEAAVCVALLAYWGAG